MINKAFKIGLVPLFAVLVLFLFSGYKQQIPVFSSENAFKYLEKQCEFGPRYIGSPGYIACLEFFKNELSKFATSLNVQRFSHRDENRNRYLALNNVIADFKGTGTSRQKVLIAAHWDTREFADSDPDETNHVKPIIGANDGASGVAVLLEIAKIMKENPPPVDVQIVFFDGEDYGTDGRVELLGSRYFANNTSPSMYKFGILIDMIGDKSLNIPKEEYSNTMMPDLVKKVWRRAGKLKLKSFSNRVGYNIIDDHRPLIEKGIPIINIIDFDYEYWHTLEDTPDKCSPESLDQIGRLLLSIIYEGL